MEETEILNRHISPWRSIYNVRFLQIIAIILVSSMIILCGLFTYRWDCVGGIVDWFYFSTYYRHNRNPDEPQVGHTTDTKGDYFALASHYNLAELSLDTIFRETGVILAQMLALRYTFIHCTNKN